VVLEHTPEGETRSGIEAARGLSDEASVRVAVRLLGNGSQISAPDTVPFALWCAARHTDDFCEALWSTVSGLGDRDTTCAMVGGIVASAVGRDALPSAWLAAREALP
jgi:ADP-ribosylglycohydrolase